MHLLVQLPVVLAVAFVLIYLYAGLALIGTAVMLLITLAIIPIAASRIHANQAAVRSIVAALASAHAPCGSGRRQQIAEYNCSEV